MPTVVGIFTDTFQAEKAVEEIRHSGIAEDKISVVATHDTIHARKYNADNERSETLKAGKDGQLVSAINTADRQNISTGTTTGGAFGGVTGLLAGAGLFTIPGLGPILALGPIAAGLAGAAVGGIAGSLADLGIAPEKTDHYKSQVKEGGILGTVVCDQTQVNDVVSIFRDRGALDIETH